MLKYRKVLNDAKTVGTSSSSVLAENDARKRAIICNGHASNSAWVSFGEAAIVGKGVYLAPNGGSFEIPPDELYTGQVFCIASGAGTLIGIVEFS
jgi:hypothetical protein